MEGWIKIHRKLITWEWYNDSKMVHLFLHLLLSANHLDGKWQGVSVKRGQLITGRIKLSAVTGISEQSIRTCLSKLESTKELTIKTTNKNSLITLLNYDSYQIKESANQQSTSKLTNNQPTTNQQLTTNNNDKNKKNEIIVDMETPNFNPVLNKIRAMEDKKVNMVFDGVVKMNGEEFEKLCNQYELKDIQSKINSLSTGIHNKDKKYLNYKDHYRTVSNWLNKDCPKKTNGRKLAVQF